MIKNHIIPILLIIIFLTGCQASGKAMLTTPPTLIAIPGEVKTQLLPLQTTTPNPIHTLTHLPTETSVPPTQTPIPAPTLKISQTVIANEQTQNAGNFLTSTALVQSIQATITPRIFQSFPSPDGKWLAQVNLYDCAQIVPEAGNTFAYEILQISSWTAETQLLACGGLGWGGLAGLFWSPGSRFFYYTDAREGSASGFPWLRPITRFDVNTGKSDVLGSAAYSPDGKKIAGAQDADLVIWEINHDTGANTADLRFPGSLLDQAWVNWVSWSPDGRSLVYLTQSNCGSFPCPTALTRVDLDTQTQTQLLGANDPSIAQVDWSRPNMLLLDTFGIPRQYSYDLTRKRLSPVPETTPTPGPSPTPAPPRSTETPVPTYPPDPAYPSDRYPPAMPFRQPVDRDLLGHGCPNQSGVQVEGKPAIAAIQPVLEAVRSGDVYKIRANSDTAYWPVTGLSLQRQSFALDPSNISLLPAAQSSLADLLIHLCGTELLRASWLARVNAADGISDYILLYRKDRWLIWLGTYDNSQFQP